MDAFEQSYRKVNEDEIPVGIEVIGFDGKSLGYIREARKHFLLVGTDSSHEDLEIPVQSIIAIENGKLRVHVAQESASPVDDEETAHRLDEM